MQMGTPRSAGHGGLRSKESISFRQTGRFSRGAVMTVPVLAFLLGLAADPLSRAWVLPRTASSIMNGNTPEHAVCNICPCGVPVSSCNSCCSICSRTSLKHSAEGARAASHSVFRNTGGRIGAHRRSVCNARARTRASRTVESLTCYLRTWVRPPQGTFEGLTCYLGVAAH